MDSGRRGRVDLGQPGVRRRRSGLVVQAGRALTRSRLGRGRQRQVGERGAEVEAGAADDDRRSAGGEDLVDRSVRQRRVLAHRRLVVELPDADEARRIRGLVREDREAPVRLHGVRRHEIGRNPLGNCLGNRGFATRAGPENADYRH